MANLGESQDPEQLEKIESSLTKAEMYIENNQKKLMYIIGALVLLVVVFMAYKNVYVKNQEEKAQTAIWPAENAFKVDTAYQVALYGNDNVVGFAEVAKKYSSTKSGNLAKCYAGICCLHLGEFENAIKYFEDFETEDPIVGPIAISGIGDAYSELGKLEQAAENYMKAAEMSNHELTSPKFLMKAGLVYEKLGKKDKALEVYTKIKDTYDTSQEAAVIEKYITRVSFK